MIVHRITYALARRCQRIDLIVSRRVPSHAVTLGAIAVSAVAGLTLALGGLTRRPELWLAVPPLVLIRLAFGATHRRPRLSRRSPIRRESLVMPRVEETYVEVPDPPPIEDEMLHALGR